MNFSFFFGCFFLGMISIFISMFIFIIQRFHFLMSLLCLEFMVLGLFFCSLSVYSWKGESFLVFILLSFAACEAALGLGLLVSLIRSHGSDFLKVVSLYEC
uniref:NADH-ubiquinone oxidoreductase chain 4L n=1 Tax=Paranemertes cf. peregrina SCS-2010 TaxID=743461 RepID=E7C199_9BILA|nr:NADH dehydrogenase subunit 4L [Paranemertes cf. peregrina SCS-2010]ADD62159.1 NADH dehydrogenase subunit 4L [Paranemertes cf. peregrina SCS-2010]